MFKSVVAATRENIVGSTKLFDVSQSLELWGVDYPHTQRVNFNVAVDRVIENLKTANKSLFRKVQTDAKTQDKFSLQSTLKMCLLITLNWSRILKNGIVGGRMGVPSCSFSFLKFLRRAKIRPVGLWNKRINLIPGTIWHERLAVLFEASTNTQFCARSHGWVPQTTSSATNVPVWMFVFFCSYPVFMFRSSLIFRGVKQFLEWHMEFLGKHQQFTLSGKQVSH